MLATETIVKKYGDHLALDGVSIEVPTGKVFGLLGPNGAGKTTLIRIITRITGPDSGKVLLNGRPMTEADVATMGYLPEALRNYLARLGWSHGDDEIMSTADMVSWFNIGDINKGAARMDYAKLEAVNGSWMRRMDDAALTRALVDTLPYLEGMQWLADGIAEKGEAPLIAAMAGLKDRAKTLIELAASAAYLYATRPLPLDEKAAAILNDEGRAALASVLPVLESAAEWQAAALEAAVKVHAEAAGLKLGKIAQPLRAALTGKATSPGVFDVLEVLGRSESLARLKDQTA